MSPSASKGKRASDWMNRELSTYDMITAWENSNSHLGRPGRGVFRWRWPCRSPVAGARSGLGHNLYAGRLFHRVPGVNFSTIGPLNLSSNPDAKILTNFSQTTPSRASNKQV
jgi:hypothetical protein